MAEVHSLHGALVPVREVDENAIAVLEDALERARAGEVVGVLVCEQTFDGLATYRFGGRTGTYALTGAVSVALGWLHNRHTLEG